MTDWRRDKHWADQHLAEIERVIGSVAGEIISIDVASQLADQKYGTDYIVKVSKGDIACRIRGWHYWVNFHDFTLRSARRSGVETELSKIRNGYARWYLYAWVKSERMFGAWIFVDLDILRSSGLLERQHKQTRNRDGASKFISLALAELAGCGCILHAGGEAKDLIRYQQKQLIF